MSETPVRSAGPPPFPEAGEGAAGSVFAGPVGEGVIGDDVGRAPEATGDDGPTERPGPDGVAGAGSSPVDERRAAAFAAAAFFGGSCRVSPSGGDAAPACSVTSTLGGAALGEGATAADPSGGWSGIASPRPAFWPHAAASTSSSARPAARLPT
ncbi:MAG TPA: hypothetical protein VG034_05195 [Acidimicrobiia bacterium]|nr:hypothetical protein [Acidimicrobiia bacterium]